MSSTKVRLREVQDQLFNVPSTHNNNKTTAIKCPQTFEAEVSSIRPDAGFNRIGQN